MKHIIVDQYGRLLDEDMQREVVQLIQDGKDTYEGDLFTVEVVKDERSVKRNLRTTTVRTSTNFGDHDVN